jgi:hypothetical protein
MSSRGLKTGFWAEFPQFFTNFFRWLKKSLGIFPDLSWGEFRTLFLWIGPKFVNPWDVQKSHRNFLYFQALPPPPFPPQKVGKCSPRVFLGTWKGKGQGACAHWSLSSLGPLPALEVTWVMALFPLLCTPSPLHEKGGGGWRRVVVWCVLHPGRMQCELDHGPFPSPLYFFSLVWKGGGGRRMSWLMCPAPWVECRVCWLMCPAL